MVCKGLCTKYRVKKPGKNSRYEAGQKRCSQCEIFVCWDGKHCPCCGYVLRTKPRGTLARHRMLLIAKQTKFNLD